MSRYTVEHLTEYRCPIEGCGYTAFAEDGATCPDLALAHGREITIDGLTRFVNWPVELVPFSPERHVVKIRKVNDKGLVEAGTATAAHSSRKLAFAVAKAAKDAAPEALEAVKAAEAST